MLCDLISFVDENFKGIKNMFTKNLKKYMYILDFIDGRHDFNFNRFASNYRDEYKIICIKKPSINDRYFHLEEKNAFDEKRAFLSNKGQITSKTLSSSFMLQSRTSRAILSNRSIFKEL